MSADLEIRVPIIKIAPTTSQDSDKINLDGDISDEECQTPRSPEHMIPAFLSCPPVLRKPPPQSLSCKRKLCELDFFEAVAREEIESFFRRAEGNSGGAAAVKRRCLTKISSL